MITIGIAPLVMILGALVYRLSTRNAEFKEMGRIAFAAGLLVTLAGFALGLFHR